MVENIKNETNIFKEKESSSIDEDEIKLSVDELIDEMDFQTDKKLTIEEMDKGVAKAFVNWKEENA